MYKTAQDINTLLAPGLTLKIGAPLVAMVLCVTCSVDADDNLIFESDDFFAPCFRQTVLPKDECKSYEISNDIDFTYIVVSAGLVENVVFADSFSQDSKQFQNLIVDHYRGRNQYGISLTNIENRDGSLENYFELQYSRYGLWSVDSLRGSLFLANGKEPADSRFTDYRIMFDVTGGWLGAGIGVRYRDREKGEGRWSAEYHARGVVSDNRFYSFSVGALLGHIYESKEVQFGIARLELSLSLDIWRRLDLNIRYYPLNIIDKQAEKDRRSDADIRQQFTVFLEYSFSRLGKH